MRTADYNRAISCVQIIADDDRSAAILTVRRKKRCESVLKTLERVHIRAAKLLPSAEALD
jgi:hypothetical protein